MADGDLLYAGVAPCYQAQIDDYLIGSGAPWRISSVDGVGARAATGPRTQRDMAPGEIVGVQVPTAGAVAITAFCRTGDVASMEVAIAALADAWIPSTEVLRGPKRLDLLIPGRGHLYVMGTPVQVSPMRTFAAGGAADVVLTFAKSDPTEHTVEPQPS